MGKGALTSHAGGAKHQSKANTSSRTVSIASLFKSAGTSVNSTSSNLTTRGGSAAAPLSSDSTAHPHAGSAPASTHGAAPTEQGGPSESPGHRVVAAAAPSGAAVSFTPAPAFSRPTMRAFIEKDEVTVAEIRLCMFAVQNHLSTRNIGSLVTLFPLLFPDSKIAQNIQLQKSKVAYSIVYGLSPYFTKLFRETISSCDMFCVGFDESMNKISQKQQMDIELRFWDPVRNEASARYLTSVFLGKTAADDLVTAFQGSLEGLDMNTKLLQISMDGPNVNKSFHSKIKEYMKESGTGDTPVLLEIGTCGLHTVHVAFKTGSRATGWKIVEFLRALYCLFKNVPARRADFIRITGTSVFPLKFFSVRWVENKKVASRCLEVLPAVRVYVAEVERVKKERSEIRPKPKLTLSIPECDSYETVKEALQDKLLVAKVTFFESIAGLVEPFLTEFQSSKPLAPFLYNSLNVLVKDILSRVVKKEVLESSLPHKIDLTEKKNLLFAKDVNIGYATRSALRKCEKVIDKDMLLFKNDCRTYMISFVEKLLEKSPLAYSFTKNLSCLDPEVALNESTANKRLSGTLTELTRLNRVTGNTADCIDRQFKELMSLESVQEYFRTFDRKEHRLDHFWLTAIGDKSSFNDLKEFVKLICILYHGNASLERGFSINKECIVENQTEASLVAQRVVYDAIIAADGQLQNVEIPKSMIHSFRNAHSMYKEKLKKDRENAKADREKESRKRENVKKMKELEAKRLKIKEHAEKELAVVDEEIKTLRK